jgi:hypothetical protein
MEPEDLDAVLERRVPADLGTAHMAARAAWAQGKCLASARSWKTSAHQEISREAPNY